MYRAVPVGSWGCRMGAALAPKCSGCANQHGVETRLLLSDAGIVNLPRSGVIILYKGYTSVTIS